MRRFGRIRHTGRTVAAAAGCAAQTEEAHQEEPAADHETYPGASSEGLRKEHKTHGGVERAEEGPAGEKTFFKTWPHGEIFGIQPQHPPDSFNRL